MKRILTSLLTRFGLIGPAFALRQQLWRLKPATLWRNLGYRLHGAPDGLPMPETRARMRVGGSPDADWFFRSGRMAADSIREAVEAQGRSLGTCGRLLDFGCGCGRVLRHWHALADRVAIVGTDFQQPLLRECHRVLPFARLAVNGPEPPLPFADGVFDLVYCLSVFTHFDMRQERLWRDELHRVLRPGGLLLFSTQGAAYADKLSRAERDCFDRGGAVFRRTSFRGLNLCMTFHPESYVRRVLADGFSIVDYRPEGARGNPPQDLFVLRRELSRLSTGPGPRPEEVPLSCSR